VCRGRKRRKERKKEIYTSCKKSVLSRMKENPFIDYVVG
jgi:hypothetical protein